MGCALLVDVSRLLVSVLAFCGAAVSEQMINAAVLSVCVSVGRLPDKPVGNRKEEAIRSLTKWLACFGVSSPL